MTTVSVATIGFSYDLQTSFMPALNNNDRDRADLVAFNDSLWLFSKNWVRGNRHISKLPAEPGNQTAVRVDTLDSQGMITGASFDPSTGDVALMGCTDGSFLPFAWHLREVNGPGLSRVQLNGRTFHWCSRSSKGSRGTPWVRFS